MTDMPIATDRSAAPVHTGPRSAITAIEPYGYFALLMVAWCGAWLLFRWAAVGDLSSRQQLVYWTTAKVLIWIAPILVIVRVLLRRPLGEYLGLVRARHGTAVGLVTGTVFVGLAATLDVFTREYGWPTPSAGLFNALVIAPLFEEVMFRGYAMRILQDRGYGFWTANLIAALMFVGLHLPGWSFMGGLDASRLVMVVSIVLIGLVAGYAKRRAHSTWAAVVFHGVNNLYSAFLR